MTTTQANTLLLALLAALLTMVLAAASPVAASARMVSQKIAPNVCLTTGGGRFVAVPGFPGERIDRRLLADIKYLQRHYKIFLTDGLSEDPVHAANGEHPIGLAADIVPDAAAGGTWADVTALANWAEPTQDHPVAPFRWVGYDGDAGHGRGDHLHLSWDHSETKPGVPAASVYTLRCPTAQARQGQVPPVGQAPPAGPGDEADHQPGHRHHGGGGKNDGGSSGGTDAGTGSGSTDSGGIGVSRIAAELRHGLGRPVVETDGVGLR